MHIAKLYNIRDGQTSVEYSATGVAVINDLIAQPTQNAIMHHLPQVGQFRRSAEPFQAINDPTTFRRTLRHKDGIKKLLDREFLLLGNYG
jgi:hypothetical protein